MEKNYMEIWEAKNVKILKYDYTELMKCGVKEEDAFLLSKFGVPEAVAPGLSFRLFESQITNRNGEEYIILGFTGNGDEICLEKVGGKIIVLDHETDENILLNSSIRKMYECLGCYTDFIDQIRNQNGKLAFIKKIFSRDDIDSLKERIIKIDTSIMNENSFWKNELDDLYESIS